MRGRHTDRRGLRRAESRQEEGGVSFAASCASVVVWNDVVYSGNALDEPLDPGRELGTGFIPPCGDTNQGDPLPGTEVRVRASAGVPAAVAVLVERDPAREAAVYLAPGYLLQNPDHPLHDALYGGPEEPNEARGLECEPPVEFPARAQTTPGPVVFRVASDDAAVEPLLARYDEGTVFVDAHTVVSGLERNGITYVAEGDELELVVRACSGADGVRMLVVKSLKRR